MKKRFLVACLLSVLCFGVQAQFTKHVITSGTGYFAGNNVKIGFLLHRAADRSKKQPIIIHLHGVGEQTSSTSVFFDTTTAAGLDKLDNAGYGLPYYFSTATSPMSTRKYRIPGAATGDSVQFYMIAPQCAKAYGYWIRTYVHEMLKFIKTNLANEVDTTRIYLTGLSLGGGGTLIACTDPVINVQLAAVHPICAGYATPLSSGDPSAYQMLARSGLPIWFTHSRDDSVTTAISGSNPRDGTLYTQRAIDSLNYFKALYPYKYFKFTTGDHGIWDRSYNPANATNQYPTVNGVAVDFTPSIYTWFLQFSTAYQRKPAGY